MMKKPKMTKNSKQNDNPAYKQDNKPMPNVTKKKGKFQDNKKVEVRKNKV